MSRMAVITGGAGGMGLATAKIVGRDHQVVLCDVTDKQAVALLFKTAAGLGTVVSVIHTAGVSPSMGDADYVMRSNALGTVNVNEVFYNNVAEGSAIVNVASMSAHMLPACLRQGVS